MNTQSRMLHTKHQRRARAVYGATRSARPATGLIAAELGILALIALAAAAVLATRAALALPL